MAMYGWLGVFFRFELCPIVLSSRHSLLNKAMGRAGMAKRKSSSINAYAAKMLTTVSPVLRRNVFMRIMLIQFEFVSPIALLSPLRLVFFKKKEVAKDQAVHLGAHEACVCIFRSHHYGLSAHIEAGIYNQAVAALAAEGIDKRPVSRVGFL